ncbi:hypothetical protein D9M70_515020 [compost metagenome]
MGPPHRGRGDRERQSRRNPDPQARADRRRGVPDPIQLSDLYARAEDRPGVDCWQRRCRAAEQQHADFRFRRRRGNRRSGSARRPRQHPHHVARCREDALHPSRRRHDHADGQRFGRPHRARILQGKHRQAVARTRWQDARHRRTGRGSRCRGADDHRRQDHPLRPGLYQRRAALRS